MERASKLPPTPEGWTVSSCIAAPQRLLEKLLSCDKRAENQYTPDW